MKDEGAPKGKSDINPVDLYVGGRVRLRRKFLGLSQEQLAAHIKLTFQQVQKYERGSNRISASKLYEIAEALKVPIGYFFEGYEALPDDDGQSDRAVSAFLMTTEGIELATAFPQIKSKKQRRVVIELVRGIAGDE